MEMIDRLTIQAVEDAFGCGYRDADAGALIELDGLAGRAWTSRPSASSARAGVRRARGARRRDEAERQLLWKGRKSAFGAYGRISPGLHGDGRRHPAHEAAPYVLSRVNEIVAASACASATCSTPATATCTRTSSTIRACRAKRRGGGGRAEIMKVCAEVGGSISGEHGIGLEKPTSCRSSFLDADPGVHASSEERVQPTGLCNPGQGLSHQEVLREVGPSPTGRTRSKRRASPSASSAGGRRPCRRAPRQAPRRRRRAHVLTGVELSPTSSTAARPSRRVPGTIEEVAAVMALAAEVGRAVTRGGRHGGQRRDATQRRGLVMVCAG
jgi:glycolate oxidase